MIALSRLPGRQQCDIRLPCCLETGHRLQGPPCHCLRMGPAISTHLQVREAILQQADAPLHQAIGIKCLLSCWSLQLLWSLHSKVCILSGHTQSIKHEPNFCICQQALANTSHHLGEQHHAVDAMGPGLCNRVEQPMPPAQPVYSWHGGDGDVLLSIVDEDRQDEVCRRHTGL